MKRETITAVIPAPNKKSTPTRCLKSLTWCDKIEILIIRQSNDFTQVQRKINRAIDRASTDWVLRIDTDEEVTPELREEILNILGYPGKVVAYGVPRRQFFAGRFLTGGDWAYDRLIRLFRPKFARYDPIVPVHEQFKVTGPTSVLKSPLNHYSHPTLKDAIKKFDSYTTIEAAHLKLPVWLAFLKLFLVPPYVLGRWMIWHQGYKDGFRGLVAGSFRAWYDWLLFKKYLVRKLS